MDKAKIHSIIDRIETLDVFSTAPRERLKNGVCRSLHRLSSIQRDRAVYALEHRDLSRREFLTLITMTGVGVAVGGSTWKLLHSLEQDTVSGYIAHNKDSGSYEIKEVPANDDLELVVRGDDTLENILYDVSADGAGVTIRLFDNATVRNIGVQGGNESDKHVFRVGGNAEHVTISHVFADCFKPGWEGGGIIVTVGNTGRVDIRESSIHGFSNNGLYASKSNGPVYVENSYHTNNTVAQFRGGGGVNPNNVHPTPDEAMAVGDPDCVFRNCVAVVDEKSHETPNYPYGGGNRKAGFWGRHGTIEMHDCESIITPDANKGGGWCVVAGRYGRGGQPGWAKVYDSEINPKDSIGGKNVDFVRNVGDNPSGDPPENVPMDAVEAASGASTDSSVSDRNVGANDRSMSANDGTKEPC